MERSEPRALSAFRSGKDGDIVDTHKRCNLESENRHTGSALERPEKLSTRQILTWASNRLFIRCTECCGQHCSPSGKWREMRSDLPSINVHTLACACAAQQSSHDGAMNVQSRSQVCHCDTDLSSDGGEKQSMCMRQVVRVISTLCQSSAHLHRRPVGLSRTGTREARNVNVGKALRAMLRRPTCERGPRLLQ